MKKIVNLLLALLPLALAAQQNDPKALPPSAGTAPYDYPNNFTGPVQLNYVRTIEPVMPVTEAALGGLRNFGGRTLEKTVYLDGYMRPLQVVIKKPVNAYSRDLVKFYNYDASGRITDDMLPFTKADRSVAQENKFDKNIQSDQVLTYTNLNYTGDNYRFERTLYEASLLGRVTETRGAGNAWTGKNKGVTTQTRVATTLDDVRQWTIDYAPGSAPNHLGPYPPADIVVHTVTDEDGLTAKQFYNTEGQLVAAENEGLRTYYVYDIYNRLRYVLPPKAIEACQNNGWSLNATMLANLCFRYEYDARGNQVALQKPGVGVAEFRYDLYGRVVFSQDAVQRAQNNWVFYKYDMKGRLIQQGLFNTGNGGYVPASPEEVTPTSVLHVLVDYIYNTKVYKSSDYQYSIADAQFMIHYYFDTYDFMPTVLYPPNGAYSATQLQYVSAIGSATEGYNTMQNEYPTGLLTGIYTAVSDNSKWIAHINYYNTDGLLIQTLSDDLQDRISVSGMGYDFKGRLTKTVFQNNDATIQKKYTYDCYNRLRYITHKLGNASSYRRIAQYEYDELGRMSHKMLGSVNYVETYDYNIRNWITGINKKYCTEKTDGFHFGEELFYENGFTQTYLNGRLAGMQWRSHGTQDDLRAYGYLYDNNQRLNLADYYQKGDKDWTKDKDFTTTVSYDVNGNIQAMKHMGLDAGGNNIVLDDLAYAYESYSNKLLQVAEKATSQSTNPAVHDGLGDFRDVAGTDYTYDANGNLASDGNRQVSEIQSTWFTINKPLRVEMGNGNSVQYVYDALGNVLRKKATWQDASYNIKITDYVGELTYEENEVALVAHDEGRVRLVPDPLTGVITYEYDYYLRDHLQNIRAIITEKVVQGLEQATAFDPATYNPANAATEPGPVSYDQDPVGYIATSEPENEPWETDLFDRVDETRGTRPLSANPEDQYAAALDAASSRTIGPGKLLKVMAGDRIELGAEAFFHSDQNPGVPVPINTLATQLISALSGAAAITGEISNVFSQALLSPEAVGMALNDITSQAENDTTAPSAYLNYLVFDESFNILSDASGAIQVQQANAWQNMSVPQFEIQQNGYVYVFTSNQSQSTVNTDNLYIYHWTSVLLEEFHYYPFGLTFEVSQQFKLPGSNQRYNSQSIERDEFTAAGGEEKYGLNWYDFMARSYDAQIGRWMQPDPMMQHASPYLAMSNNPTSYTDPDGMYDGCPDCPKRGTNNDSYISEDGLRYGYFNGEWQREILVTAPKPFASLAFEASSSDAFAAGGSGGGVDVGAGPTDYGSKKYMTYSESVQARNRQLAREEANRKSLEADLHREYRSYGWSHEQNMAASKLMLTMAIPYGGILRGIGLGARLGYAALGARIGSISVPVYRAYGGAAFAAGRSWSLINPRVFGVTYRFFGGIPKANTMEYMIKGTTQLRNIEWIRPAVPILKEGSLGHFVPEVLLKNPSMVEILNLGF